MFFVFKQKTAYEMRISDWSSDVCSSDLCTIPIGEPCNSSGDVPSGRIRDSRSGPGRGRSSGWRGRGFRGRRDGGSSEVARTGGCRTLFHGLLEAALHLADLDAGHVDAAVPKQQTGDDVIPVGRHIEGLHSSCRTLAEIAAHPALVTQECQRDALRLQVSDGRRKIVPQAGERPRSGTTILLELSLGRCRDRSHCDSGEQSGKQVTHGCLRFPSSHDLSFGTRTCQQILDSAPRRFPSERGQSGAGSFRGGSTAGPLRRARRRLIRPGEVVARRVVALAPVVAGEKPAPLVVALHDLPCDELALLARGTGLAVAGDGLNVGARPFRVVAGCRIVLAPAVAAQEATPLVLPLGNGAGNEIGRANA